MTKLTGEARKEVIQQMNEQIAKNPTPDGRRELIDVFTRLLTALDSYRGFNYVYWMEKGFLEWRAAGSPANHTKFLGDQTMIKFY